MNTEESILKMEEQAAAQPFLCHYYREALLEMEAGNMEKCLLPTGWFQDLDEGVHSIQTALQRLACIAVTYHWKQGRPWPEGPLKENVLKGIVNYCARELGREDKGNSRFHMSIFRVPACVLNVYFALYPELKDAKEGFLGEVRQIILKTALQTFTLPERGDETDQNPFSVERFQGHVWWEGANALSYRPVFRVALACRSEKLIRVLTEVAVRSLTPTCAACPGFWREGMCADGFGWGHGRQSYNSGYPTEGVLAALDILTFLKGTVWEKELARVSWSSIVRYMEGISWSTFRGRNAPMQTRNIFYRKDQIDAKSLTTSMEYALEIRELLRNHFMEYLSSEEVSALENFSEESQEGIRYFWNNDALVRKDRQGYFYFNMASNRCDGVEFADSIADKRNYFTADGTYVIMRDEREYREAFGTWQVCHFPGATERYLPNREILTEVNWHGYRSVHPFAAGATSGCYGLAGFIYEKDGSREADGKGEIYDHYTREILGVMAYKSVFLFGDTMLFLGAGITDRKPEYGRHIHTTVDNRSSFGTAVIQESEEAVSVFHDNMRYTICKIEGNEIVVSQEERRTHWADLNEGNRDERDESVPVLEIIIDHGLAPVDGKYAYYIERNVSDSGQSQEEKPVILANTIGVQAARQNDVVQAVFYDNEAAVKVDENTILRVSHPCAVLLKKEADGFEITVCDGLQQDNLGEITVYYGSLEWKIAVEKKVMTGKPVTVKLRKLGKES